MNFHLSSLDWFSTRWGSCAFVVGSFDDLRSSDSHPSAADQLFPLLSPILSTNLADGCRHGYSDVSFSVVVLRVALQFENYSSTFVEESEGEFELMLTAAHLVHCSLKAPSPNGNSNTQMGTVLMLWGGFIARRRLSKMKKQSASHILRGVDGGFADHGGPLHIWDASLGDSSEEAWSTMLQRRCCFCRCIFRLRILNRRSECRRVLSFAGENITIIDAQQPSHRREMVVGGILEQSSYRFQQAFDI